MSDEEKLLKALEKNDILKNGKSGIEKTCPFCGGEVDIMFHNGTETWKFECDDCQTEFITDWRIANAAIRFWNTRH